MYQVEIGIEGHLNEQWLVWLGDFSIVHPEPNESILTGHIPDQAALYGLIGKLRDLGVKLISINYRSRPAVT